jgi:L-malate glycosyltransferase
MNLAITCFPTFGGSGVIATEIGLAMARRGHRVHFVCAELPWRFDRFADNVLFHEVETRDYPLFDQSPYTLALTSKLVEVATWEKLDVLHVHYAIPHAVSAYLARQILGSRAPKIVATLHGTDITVVGSDPSFLPVTRFAIESADAVTVPSKALRAETYDKLALSHSVPIEVIPNFVDCDVYSPGHEQRRPLIVHNSNFRPVKRVEDVVRVFAAVRERTPCDLALIGDGPERSRAERLVHELGLQSNVRFLGKQRHFVEVLRQASVFLQPSAVESFGLAALEAMACGVPVVATRTGGVPEVVGDGGLLAEVGDVPALAAAVEKLLIDESLREKMGAAARARAQSRFALPQMIDRWQACYAEVMASSTRRAPS